MKVKLKAQTEKPDVKEFNLHHVPTQKPKPNPGVLSRMVDIVVDDICIKLNINRKARADKMAYESFMERFK